ncbi:hypothetical protein GCM10010345_62410 [Streptomyces canarius]|uniref:Uncharacterized protein n=1 Tax=Streptomyces canarius TaxID=285453 RepID=A0ABQ3CY35_9ACTN|nr:hypothetical protein GCM10010345_62410 [Streptomyces canarius]
MGVLGFDGLIRPGGMGPEAVRRVRRGVPQIPGSLRLLVPEAMGRGAEGQALRWPEGQALREPKGQAPGTGVRGACLGGPAAGEGASVHRRTPPAGRTTRSPDQ